MTLVIKVDRNVCMEKDRVYEVLVLLNITNIEIYRKFYTWSLFNSTFIST